MKKKLLPILVLSSLSLTACNVFGFDFATSSFFTSSSSSSSSKPAETSSKSTSSENQDYDFDNDSYADMINCDKVPISISLQSLEGVISINELRDAVTSYNNSRTREEEKFNISFYDNDFGEHDAYIGAKEFLYGYSSAATFEPYTGKYLSYLAETVSEEIYTTGKKYKYDSDVVGYPIVKYNTFNLIYDSRYLSPTEITDFETILKKARDLNKQVGITLDNGWYLASFFMGEGALGKDSLTCVDNGDGTTHMETTWNSDRGVQIANYLTDLLRNYSDVIVNDYIINDSKLAVFSGLWEKGSYGMDGNFKFAEVPNYKLPNGDVVAPNSFSATINGCINTKSSKAEKQTARAFMMLMMKKQLQENILLNAGQYYYSPTNAEVLKNIYTQKYNIDDDTFAYYKQLQRTADQFQSVNGMYWEQAYRIYCNMRETTLDWTTCLNNFAKEVGLPL